MNAASGEEELRKATVAAVKVPFKRAMVLGQKWCSIFTPLMELSPELANAAELYIKAAVQLDRNVSHGSFLAYLEATHRLEERLDGVGGRYIEPIIRDVETRCLQYQTLGPEAVKLSPKGVILRQTRRPLIFQDRIDAARELDVALAQSRFRSNLRKVHDDLRESRNLNLLPAFRQLGAVIGPDFDDAWKPVFEYLARHEDKIAAAMEKLKNARGQAAREKAMKSVQSYRNNIKGRLGEAYVRKWYYWREMKKSLRSSANRRIAELNRASRANGQDVVWSLLEIPPGKILLDRRATWDEAMLIVEEARSGAPYRRVHVFATAQVKVEEDLTALTQSWKDELREGGFFSKKASPQLPVLTVEQEGGGVEYFYVLPPDPNHRPIRWAFAPDGVNIPVDA